MLEAACIWDQLKSFRRPRANKSFNALMETAIPENVPESSFAEQDHFRYLKNVEDYLARNSSRLENFVENCRIAEKACWTAKTARRTV